MIPLRIRLQGFLSYRAEQTLDFEGASVWMLAGPNGSGKSSVFDALTFALFGRHRNGSDDAAELINKSSDGLRVEFEFAIGAHQYQIRRTLKRAVRGRSATQQILGRDGPDGSWTPISETNKKRGFDDWIRRNIGLRHETFTSSVLLLQGQADRLLSQTPAERFKVLADVVDLERYQMLHERVDAGRKRLKTECEVLSHQLEALPQIPADQLANVAASRDTAMQDRDRLVAILNELQKASIAAHRWADLKKRMDELSRRRSLAERQIGEAPALERHVRRLADLQAVVPLAERALTERGGVETARRAIGVGLENEKGAAAAADTLASQLETARGRIAKFKQNLTADEARHAKLSNERPALAAAVARIDAIAGQQLELRKLEEQWNALPPALNESLRECTTAVDELTELSRGLPILKRIRKDRASLLTQMGHSGELTARLQAVTARGGELSDMLSKLQPELETAARATAQAQDAVVTARTLRQQAEARLQAVKRLTDAPECSLCGQPLTPAHRAQELTRRTGEFESAGRSLGEAEAAAAAIQRTVADLSQRSDALTRERDIQREAYRECKQSAAQCETDIERIRQSVGEAFRELPDSQRGRVAPEQPGDWATTSFPSEDDLAAIQRHVDQAPEMRQRLESLQAQQKLAGELRSTIESLRRGIAAVTLASPDVVESARRTLARCEADLATVTAHIGAWRAEIASAEREFERINRELDLARRTQSEMVGTIQAERATLNVRESALVSALAALPDDWRPVAEQAGLADLDSWKQERDRLRTDRVAERWAELDVTRAELAAAAQEDARLAAEIEQIPTESRCEVAAIESKFQAAKIEMEHASQRLQQQSEELSRLQERHIRRTELCERLAHVRADHERHERLADLLGRNRLQMDLVRRAERQIVEMANAALDRVSGGSLHLRRRPGEDASEIALDLECVNRAAGEAAIAVPFLSGSQRFRVAVSLALGIGRFASGQHRPIESVIIDEGFGSLDRNGRQVMIQELQNLRGFLKCILLVSHQEEFADAFDDGYRFELVDGATRVTRYVRGFAAITE